MLICKDDKIVVLTILQKKVVNWYYTYLLYLGKVRTEANIRSHIKVCNTCQKNKK